MKRKEQNKELSLFLTFLKIGAFTFGGGYAMIPLIRAEVVEQKKWLREEEIVDIIAIAESTPGPLAINSATFVGYRTAGFVGALLSTCGVVLPSFIIILILAGVIRQFEDLKVIQYAFWGIRIGVVTLIVNALLMMLRECNKDWVSILLMVLSFLIVAIFDANVIFVLIASALAGYVYTRIKTKDFTEESK